MSPQTKSDLFSVGRWLVVTAALGGIAWATLGATVAGKLDATRFVEDSITRTGRDSLIRRDLRDLKAQSDRILRAVCTDKVVGCQ